jgi:hypothetical protein
MCYLIVHIFDVEGYSAALTYTLNPEVEPSAIVVLGMISANP